LKNLVEKVQARKTEEKPSKMSLYGTQKLFIKNTSQERKGEDNDPLRSYMDTTYQFKPKTKKQCYNDKTVVDNKQHEEHPSLMSTDSLRIPKTLPKMHVRNQTMESTNRDIKCLALKKIVQMRHQGKEKSRSGVNALQMSDYFRSLINQKAKDAVNSRQINNPAKIQTRHRNNFSNVLSSSTLNNMQGNHAKKNQNLAYIYL
jgi:hypothetical protein